MTGKTKSSNYSELEKKFFKEILKNYIHIVENKKSDSVTLAEKSEAWDAIKTSYNLSTVISVKRDVAQLKKLWTNMKTRQRNALTHERQQRLDTGGGPEVQDAEVDPDIMLMAPTLITTAPTLFSSNMDEAEIAAKRNVVDMMECEYYCNIEVLSYDSENDESLLSNSTTFNNNLVKVSTPGEIKMKRPLEENLGPRKKYDKRDESILKNKENMNDLTHGLKTSETNIINKLALDATEIKKPVVNTSKYRKRTSKDNTCNEETKSYRDERLSKIIQQEEKLFSQKLQHNQEVHDLTVAHLKQKFELEIRAATATAKLAELNLLKEQNKKNEFI